jgi:hypothetical protein
MQVHKPSLFLGAAVVGACLVAASAVQSSTAPVPTHAGVSFPTIQVAGLPTPGQMVVIKEGTPYVVAAGRRFVLTAIGTPSLGIGCRLFVDGVQELTGHPTSGTAPTASVVPVAPGFSVAAGSTITVTDAGFGGTNGNGRAWGYVAAP